MQQGLTIGSLSGLVPDYYDQKTRAEARLGRELTKDEFESKYLVRRGGSNMTDTGTSVFDPCLCEMDYEWFTAPGDAILDPFAGGSVRGIVASMMGRRYTGIDLRQEQIDANVEQGKAICPDAMPRWICGDSSSLDTLIGDEIFDHIFTCPPYGSLERYSDDERDISTMQPKDFDAALSAIIMASTRHLADDRFTTMVVGNYRDKHGFLRDLAGITIRAAEAAGLKYYNDMILVTTAGSLPVRVGKQFRSTRKVGRNHQYVLNFVKGNPKKAAQRLGDVVIPDISEEREE